MDRINNSSKQLSAESCKLSTAILFEETKLTVSGKIGSEVCEQSVMLAKV